MKKDAEEAKENCTKLEDDLLRKTKSFDELIWSWAELKKFEEEKKFNPEMMNDLKWAKASNPFYKTGPCKEFQNGACNYGNFADVEGGHPTNWCGRIHLSLPQML